MQIATFNIRYDAQSDGDFQFHHRKSLIIKSITERKPSIIAFQEVLPHVSQWLKESLHDYYVVGIGREENLNGEQTCIAYHKTSFNIIKLENFWLSPTPEIPASRFIPQSDCPRICTLLYLQELSSQKTFRIYNVHLDHEEESARLEALALLLTRIKLDNYLGFHPAILLGDFNAEPDSIEITYLHQEKTLQEATNSLGGTFHDFKRLSPAQKIDYIFVDNSIKYDNPQLWQEEDKGIPLSDHYPVSVDISLPSSLNK